MAGAERANRSGLCGRDTGRVRIRTAGQTPISPELRRFPACQSDVCGRAVLRRLDREEARADGDGQVSILHLGACSGSNAAPYRSPAGIW